MITMSILIVVVIAIAYSLLQAQLKAKKLIDQSWDHLLSELRPTETAAISLIAVEFLTPDQAQLRTEPAERWVMVGGWKGLRQLQRNADVLIALAAHAERWIPTESKSVVAQMRTESLTLRREVGLLILGRVLGPRVDGRGFRVQRAVSAYHLMVTRLLGLYHTIPSHKSDLLNTAVWGPNLHLQS